MYVIERALREKRLYTYCCEACDGTFSIEHQLTEHRTRVHGIGDTSAPLSRYTCEMCRKVYCTEEALANHCLLSKHKKRHTYRCLYCDKSFPRMVLRNRHELAHNNDLSVKCEQCDEVFENARYMKNHLHSFHRIKPGRHNARKSKNGEIQQTENPQTEPMQQRCNPVEGAVVVSSSEMLHS